MINHVVMEGRIVRNAELKSAGTSIVTTFTLVNDQSYKKDGKWIDKPCFIDCNIWGEYGNTMRQYLNKGQKLTVEGILEQNNWEDSDGKKRNSYKINVKNISIQWEKKENSATSTTSATPAEDHSLDYSPTEQEDIPF